MKFQCQRWLLKFVSEVPTNQGGSGPRTILLQYSDLFVSTKDAATSQHCCIAILSNRPTNNNNHGNLRQQHQKEEKEQ